MQGMSNQVGENGVHATPMTNSDIQVRLDERVRLVAAVLAATNYPEESQRLKPHGTHAHARATRKLLSDHSDHPAVQAAQTMLNQGAPLEALYTLVLTYLGTPGLAPPACGFLCEIRHR
jgi:hypothetical protein